MSELVRTPEDQFSRIAAQMVYALSLNKKQEITALLNQLQLNKQLFH